MMTIYTTRISVVIVRPLFSIPVNCIPAILLIISLPHHHHQQQQHIYIVTATTISMLLSSRNEYGARAVSITYCLQQVMICAVSRCAGISIST